MQKPARLMGLDVGAKVIGVALSDPLQLTARPLTTLRRAEDGSAIEELIRLIEEYEVAGLIVGRPLRLTGERSDILKIVETFVKVLGEHCSLPVVWSDERLSSKEAEELMKKLGVKVKNRRSRRDEFAAALILQWYLDETQT